MGLTGQDSSGARIALDSGKRCDSASRYIEYRERRRGHVGAEERDPRDDSQSRAPRLAAGVRVSTTGRRRESFLQVQVHARKQPSRVRLRIAEAGGKERVQRIEPDG